MLFVFVSTICLGQIREYDKLIKKYDVKQYLAGESDKNPVTFWNAVWQNNEPLMDFHKAVEKQKTAAINARKAVYEAALLSQSSYESLPLLNDHKWRIVSDTVLSRLGIKGVASVVGLSILGSDIYGEAFVIPSGHIYMAYTLFLTDSLNLNNLIGVAAHETAHFLLQHTQLEAYAVERKVQKNKVIAGVASAVNIAANAYAQANGASTEESWESVEKTTNNLFEQAEQDARFRYKYKYSREQEIEADIIALRFLEYMGIDGNCYIDALRFILKGEPEILKTDKGSTHPTKRFRIELLKRLMEFDNK